MDVYCYQRELRCSFKPFVFIVCFTLFKEELFYLITFPFFNDFLVIDLKVFSITFQTQSEFKKIIPDIESFDEAYDKLMQAASMASGMCNIANHPFLYVYCFEFLCYKL